MNKKSSQKMPIPKRLIASLLCCVCLLGGMPLAAIATVTEDTKPATETTAATEAATVAASEPASTESDPTEPAPTKSDLTEPTSSESTHTEPAPTESDPTEPTSTESDPTEPTSTESTPTEPVSADRTVTTSVGDLTFSVTGKLSETVTLNVVPLNSDAEAYIRAAVLNLGDQVTGAAYDITLCDNGEEIQPKEAVEVSIIGLASAQEVYHLPHTSAEDVMELVKDMAAEGGKLGKAITQAVKSLAGEDIPSHEKLTIRHDQGKLKFKTSGFSTYYVVFSEPKYNQAGDGLAENGDIVYMAPGATLKYDYTNGTLSEPTVTSTDTSTGSSVTAQKQGLSIVISAAPNAANSGPYTVAWERTTSAPLPILPTTTNKYKLTVYVNQEEAIGGHLEGKKLYIAVRGDGEYPGEPADNSNSYFGVDTWVGNNDVSGKAKYSYYIDEGTNYVANSFGPETVFSNDASKYISEEIGKHAAFQQSQNDTPVVGIVDHSGESIKQFVKGIDFDNFLTLIANQGNVRAVGGKQITNDNKNEYELVPYVIKYQGDNGAGWHIDCIVKLKSDVTLNYDLNIPEGYKAPDKTVPPNTQTGSSNSSFHIGAVKNDGENVTEITVTPTDANTDNNPRKLDFLGWSTNPNGSGTLYWPKDLENNANEKPVGITITQNTTLYAIWETDIAFGTGNLKIEKIVAGTSAQEMFPFKVEIAMPDGKTEPEGATYSYAVYNSTSNTKVDTKSSTIASGGTLNLAGGQYAVIKGLPSGASVTVTETDTRGHTPTWNGGTVGGSSTTTIIPDGSESKVTCTNTRITTATITVKKVISGNMLSKNDEFTFKVTGVSVAENDKTFKLKDGEEKTITVNVGDAITITEDAGNYSTTYKIGNDDAKSGGTAEITVTGDVTITFTNTKEVTIDTGISLETLPYILILAVVAVGAVVMIRKRHKRDE